MARRRAWDRRKTRTREHVIGDLAVNAVERPVLLRGFTLEEIAHDYGYDALFVTFDDAGQALPSFLPVQIKATDHPQRIVADGSLAFRLDRADLLSWLAEPFPVILCVYDVPGDVVQWLYVQRHFAALPGFSLFTMGESITVHLPATQTLTPAAVGLFSDYLARVVRQMGRVVDHAE